MLKFSDVKEKLQIALEQKIRDHPVADKEKGFTLIEGFMFMPVQKEISNNVIIGGPNIPLVGIVGKSTGQIYTFAFKAILPDEHI